MGGVLVSASSTSASMYAFVHCDLYISFTLTFWIRLKLRRPRRCIRSTRDVDVGDDVMFTADQSNV